MPGRKAVPKADFSRIVPKVVLFVIADNFAVLTGTLYPQKDAKPVFLYIGTHIRIGVISGGLLAASVMVTHYIDTHFHIWSFRYPANQTCHPSEFPCRRQIKVYNGGPETQNLSVLY